MSLSSSHIHTHPPPHNSGKPAAGVITPGGRFPPSPAGGGGTADPD